MNSSTLVGFFQVMLQNPNVVASGVMNSLESSPPSVPTPIGGFMWSTQAFDTTRDRKAKKSAPMLAVL